MAQLTNEQIRELNEKVTSGTCLVDICNTRHHISCRVNTECVVLTSLLEGDLDSAIVINLADVRKAFDDKRAERENENNVTSGSETSDK